MKNFMDYKELLTKYIAHIIYYEGMDYIHRLENPGHNIELTEVEKSELERLAKEARNKYNPQL